MHSDQLALNNDIVGDLLSVTFRPVPNLTHLYTLQQI